MTLNDKGRGLGNFKIQIADEAIKLLVTKSDGDARKCLNALELGVMTTTPDKNNVIQFDLNVAEESINKKPSSMMVMVTLIMIPSVLL